MFDESKFSPKPSSEANDISHLVEGMKDEHVNDKHEGVASTHLDEAPDVNQIVFDFNHKFASADLSKPDQLQEWNEKAQYFKKMAKDPTEGEKYLNMIEDRVRSLSESKE
jgi:hypothetical protein